MPRIVLLCKDFAELVSNYPEIDSDTACIRALQFSFAALGCCKLRIDDFVAETKDQDPYCFQMGTEKKTRDAEGSTTNHDNKDDDDDFCTPIVGRVTVSGPSQRLTKKHAIVHYIRECLKLDVELKDKEKEKDATLLDGSFTRYCTRWQHFISCNLWGPYFHVQLQMLYYVDRKAMGPDDFIIIAPRSRADAACCTHNCENYPAALQQHVTQCLKKQWDPNNEERKHLMNGLKQQESISLSWPSFHEPREKQIEFRSKHVNKETWKQHPFFRGMTFHSTGIPLVLLSSSDLKKLPNEARMLYETADAQGRMPDVGADPELQCFMEKLKKMVLQRALLMERLQFDTSVFSLYETCSIFECMALYVCLIPVRKPALAVGGKFLSLGRSYLPPEANRFLRAQVGQKILGGIGLLAQSQFWKVHQVNSNMVTAGASATAASGIPGKGGKGRGRRGGRTATKSSSMDGGTVEEFVWNLNFLSGDLVQVVNYIIANEGSSSSSASSFSASSTMYSSYSTSSSLSLSTWLIQEGSCPPGYPQPEPNCAEWIPHRRPSASAIQGNNKPEIKWKHLEIKGRTSIVQFATMMSRKLYLPLEAILDWDAFIPCKIKRAFTAPSTFGYSS